MCPRNLREHSGSNLILRCAFVRTTGSVPLEREQRRDLYPVARERRCATQLGLDKGELAYLKSKLDTRPYQQGRAEDLARNRKFLSQLNAVNAAALSPAAALNREIVIYDIGTNITAPSDLKRIYTAAVARGEKLPITFTVGTHPLGDRLLAQIDRVAKPTRVDAHDLANVHRKVTDQSRIYVLRIIIRGTGAPGGADEHRTVLREADQSHGRPPFR